MCLKLDLRKAYDSISWEFLLHTLQRFGFPSKWCKWIKACLQASFVVNVNGQYSDRFSASNGIRQGDPIAPYLFVLCMEVLGAMFRRGVENGDMEAMVNGDMAISHLMFADDLMVFAKADKRSARAIKTIVQRFAAMSGLHLNNIHDFLVVRVGTETGYALTWACRVWSCRSGTWDCPRAPQDLHDPCAPHRSYKGPARDLEARASLDGGSGRTCQERIDFM